MVRLYMDVQAHGAITRGLRLRGVDVLTAQEDGTGEMADDQLLDRATALQRVVFTQDEDFLAEANQRQTSGQPFGGVIYIHQFKTVIGQCVNDLEAIAFASDPEEYANRVLYLPL